MSVEVLSPEKAVRRYADALSKYGLHSRQAKAIREECAEDTTFLAYADALDQLRKVFGSKKAKRKAVSQRFKWH